VNQEIARFAGPAIIYLFILGLLWRCVFGSLLEDMHEKMFNSSLDSFLLPGWFRDRDFYVRFWKVCSVGVFLLVTALYVLTLIAWLKN
jgi:hypothetical protein